MSEIDTKQGLNPCSKVLIDELRSETIEPCQRIINDSFESQGLRDFCIRQTRLAKRRIKILSRTSEGRTPRQLWRTAHGGYPRRWSNPIQLSNLIRHAQGG